MDLRKGLLASSLSMALFVGGAVVGAAAQAASHEHPSAAQSSPAATMPDQDNGMRTAPDKDNNAVMQQGDRDRDAKAQDRDRDRDAKAQDRDAMSASGKEGNDLTKQEVKTWDSFLDSHPGIAQDLQRDPQKVNDPGWVSRHPELQSFLGDHPKVREELKENPSKVMNREKGFERSEDKK